MLILLIGLLAGSLIGLHHYLQPGPAGHSAVPKKTLSVP